MDELSTPYSPDVEISINVTNISHPIDLISVVEISKSPAVTDTEMSTSTITSSVAEVENDFYELQRTTSSSSVISSLVNSNITSLIDIKKQHFKVDFNGDDASPLSSFLLKRKATRSATKNSNYTEPCSRSL